jgi:hypothetical protein
MYEVDENDRVAAALFSSDRTREGLCCCCWPRTWSDEGRGFPAWADDSWRDDECGHNDYVDLDGEKIAKKSQVVAPTRMKHSKLTPLSIKAMERVSFRC